MIHTAKTLRYRWKNTSIPPMDWSEREDRKWISVNEASVRHEKAESAGIRRSGCFVIAQKFKTCCAQPFAHSFPSQPRSVSFEIQERSSNITYPRYVDLVLMGIQALKSISLHIQ